MTGVHSRDCAPCDAARAVVEMFATEFDPLDNWRDVENSRGRTIYNHMLAKTAEVLHGFPIPGVRQ